MTRCESTFGRAVAKRDKLQKKRRILVKLGTKKNSVPPRLRAGNAS